MGLFAYARNVARVAKISRINLSYKACRLYYAPVMQIQPSATSILIKSPTFLSLLGSESSTNSIQESDDEESEVQPNHKTTISQ
ncbi:unnamed protein product [Blepharisma stoltei]|uniref:Uncharacterized protein n=1 Tax=Blepharisma stoltei TaxID=1481888 RepID=A0AAU9IXW6_9CILI|nr:unnamed protein product [Blepharisma stoltei]